MNTLRTALLDYISMRRGLGHKFVQPEQRLGRFVTFMEQRRAHVVTRELALEWAMQPKDRRATWSLRLSDARGFAHYLRNMDLRHEVPAPDILPFPARRKPYLYTDAEIADLLAAALALPPSKAYVAGLTIVCYDFWSSAACGSAKSSTFSARMST